MAAGLPHVAPPAHPPSSSIEALVWLCVAMAVVVAVGLLLAPRR